MKRNLVETVEETGSTNADMIARARVGAAEGSWLRAERQTGGKGRRDRQWLSPPGNLYCSTLIRQRPSDPPAHSLAHAAALALYDAVAVLAPQLPLMLKWPNDLLLGGAKCAGILLEREGTSDAVIVGFGVNCAHAPKIEGRAISCLADHGAQIAPETLLKVLTEAMAARLNQWRTRPLGDLFDEWCLRAHPMGSAISVSMPKVLTGNFAGLDEQGALRLALPDGRIETISAGDVALIG